jgi:transposase InsO family protein
MPIKLLEIFVRQAQLAAPQTGRTHGAERGSLRRPQGGLIHHSDRGSQYASHDYQQLLAKHDLVSSMRRKGTC